MKHLLELLTVELEKKNQLFVFTLNVYNTELDFTKYVQEPSDGALQR